MSQPMLCSVFDIRRIPLEMRGCGTNPRRDPLGPSMQIDTNLALATHPAPPHRSTTSTTLKGLPPHE